MSKDNKKKPEFDRWHNQMEDFIERDHVPVTEEQKKEAEEFIKRITKK